MKKIIFRLVSVFAITAVMLVNLQFLETDNNSEITLLSLKNVAYAFGEDSGGGDDDCQGATCQWVDDDPPWWCFWCDDGHYEGAREFVSWETVNVYCTVKVVDCMPGTGQCTPGWFPSAC